MPAISRPAICLALTLALLAVLVYRSSELPASLLSATTPLGRDATNMTIDVPVFAPCPPLPKPKGEVTLKLPPTEDRPHRFIVLPNGLEVILVSDPDADKAAASMEVGVGHLSDPDDLPGCAHFWYVHSLRTNPLTGTASI